MFRLGLDLQGADRRFLMPFPGKNQGDSREGQRARARDWTKQGISEALRIKALSVVLCPFIATKWVHNSFRARVRVKRGHRLAGCLDSHGNGFAEEYPGHDTGRERDSRRRSERVKGGNPSAHFPTGKYSALYFLAPLKRLRQPDERSGQDGVRNLPD